MVHSDTALVPLGEGRRQPRPDRRRHRLVPGAPRGPAAPRPARIPSPRLPRGGSRFQDRQIRSRHHPEHHVAFAHLAAAAYNPAQLPPGVALGLDFNRRHTLGTSPYAFATHVAVVEVAQETGAIRVLHYVAVHDAGRLMNPLLAAGQVHGGIAQGIGQALLEGMVYSPEGQPLTGTLLDYPLPRASTTPTFTLDTLETLSPLTPMGAKGIGELPTLAAPVAIANAVMDALAHVGVRHIDTPSPRKRSGKPCTGRRPKADGGRVRDLHFSHERCAHSHREQHRSPGPSRRGTKTGWGGYSRGKASSKSTRTSVGRHKGRMRCYRSSRVTVLTCAKITTVARKIPG